MKLWGSTSIVGIKLSIQGTHIHPQILKTLSLSRMALLVSPCNTFSLRLLNFLSSNYFLFIHLKKLHLASIWANNPFSIGIYNLKKSLAEADTSLENRFLNTSNHAKLFILNRFHLNHLPPYWLLPNYIRLRCHCLWLTPST